MRYKYQDTSESLYKDVSMMENWNGKYQINDTLISELVTVDRN